MKSSRLLLLCRISVLSFLVVSYFIACSKGGGTTTPTDPCTGVTIVVSTTVTAADAGVSNGSITATATGSSGFTFSINNGTFQASGTFSNLAAGKYTITPDQTITYGANATFNVTSQLKSLFLIGVPLTTNSKPLFWILPALIR